MERAGRRLLFRFREINTKRGCGGVPIGVGSGFARRGILHHLPGGAANAIAANRPSGTRLPYVPATPIVTALVLLVFMTAAIIGVLAHGAGAGPLDPPGPPASTMHTLDDVFNLAGNRPPSWDQVLSSSNGAAGPIPPAGCNSDRFKCVMTYAQCSGVCITIYPAVLDEETGLVWERVPSSTTASWDTATDIFCGGAHTAQRGGWRLPTLAELMSLIEGGASNGSLPAGNPFSGISTAGAYWTSNEVPDQPTLALAVGVTSAQGLQTSGQSSLGVWCVRGATGR